MLFSDFVESLKNCHFRLLNFPSPKSVDFLFQNFSAWEMYLIFLICGIVYFLHFTSFSFKLLFYHDQLKTGYIVTENWFIDKHFMFNPIIVFFLPAVHSWHIPLHSVLARTLFQTSLLSTCIPLSLSTLASYWWLFCFSRHLEFFLLLRDNIFSIRYLYLMPYTYRFRVS